MSSQLMLLPMPTSGYTGLHTSAEDVPDCQQERTPNTSINGVPRGSGVLDTLVRGFPLFQLERAFMAVMQPDILVLLKQSIFLLHASLEGAAPFDLMLVPANASPASPSCIL